MGAGLIGRHFVLQLLPQLVNDLHASPIGEHVCGWRSALRQQLRSLAAIKHLSEIDCRAVCQVMRCNE